MNALTCEQSIYILIADRYRTMLSHLKCVIFKQADCHIVTMKRFLQKDLPTLNEEGDTVHIAVYSHNEDKALGFSQVRLSTRL